MDQIDQGLLSALQDLRARVEMVNQVLPAIALRGDTFRKPDQIQTISGDGWHIGYQLEDHTVFMRKKIYVRCDERLPEVPCSQKDPVMRAIFEVLLEQGSDIPKMEIPSPYSIILQQDFVPCVLTEMNPGIVTPGRR